MVLWIGRFVNCTLHFGCRQIVGGLKTEWVEIQLPVHVVRSGTRSLLLAARACAKKQEGA